MIDDDLKCLGQFHHHLNRGRHLVVFIAAYLVAIDLGMKSQSVLGPTLFLTQQFDFLSE